MDYKTSTYKFICPLMQTNINTSKRLRDNVVPNYFFKTLLRNKFKIDILINLFTYIIKN